MRPIDAIGLKQALAVSAILKDRKTIGQIIDEQPTIEPERKTGRWIPTYEDCCADVWVKWKCSECGYVRKKGWKQTYDGAKPDALFCEMCNADMRGERE